MKLEYFTEEAYNHLFDRMESNKELYKKTNSWLGEYFRDVQYAVESNIEYPEFKLVHTGDKTEDDYKNTVSLYNALGNILTPHQACNKYMWSYLAHEKYWDYTTKRWPVASGAAIKTRYFCGDSRIPLSLNSLSRLWWYGYLTYDENNPTDPYHLTKLMTSNTDLCQNLVQHKYSMNKTITLGILEGIKRFVDDGGVLTGKNERDLIKYINRYGAVSSLDMLDREEVAELTRKYLSET